jgi:hypothetical protein
MISAEGDPEVLTRLAAFTDGLQQLDWTHGRNLRIDARWAVDGSRNRQAEELIAQVPDVVSQLYPVRPWRRCSGLRATCRLFPANVIDPAGAGFVARWRGLVAIPLDSAHSNTVRYKFRSDQGKASRLLDAHMI